MTDDARAALAALEEATGGNRSVHEALVRVEHLLVLHAVRGEADDLLRLARRAVCFVENAAMTTDDDGALCRARHHLVRVRSRAWWLAWLGRGRRVGAARPCGRRWWRRW